MISEEKRLSNLIYFENKFADLVGKYSKEMSKAVSSGLEDVEKIIFDLAFGMYNQEQGRWWDIWHIPETHLELNYILNNVHDVQGLEMSQLKKIIIKASFDFHDSGYPKLSESKMYTSKNIRDLHARIGALNSISSLSLLKQDENYLFSREDLSEIYENILKHDDKFFDERESNSLSSLSSLPPPSLTFVVDADNCFIPSFVSAYKDYVSRYARPPSNENKDFKNMSGEEFIRMRQSYFFKFGEDKSLGQSILITPASDVEYSKKILPMEHISAKKVAAAHLLARTEELKEGLFDVAYQGDWESFKPFMINYLEKSIEFAKKGISFDVSKFVV